MHKNNGFTLIELLVVIAIIGILASVIQPMLSAGACKTRDFKCDSRMKHLATGILAYSEDYGQYPKEIKAVDSILQDKSMLLCSGTDKQYYYAYPGTNPKSNRFIAACVNPRKSHRVLPHAFGKSIYILTVNGSVEKCDIEHLSHR